MASSSSTSSSKVSDEERLPGRGWPVAVFAFLLVVAGVELVAASRHQWFADLAAWQWETKRQLVRAGELDGDVAIFGSSVLFHGLDPSLANRASGSTRVANLALNGMNLQHMTQFLEERMASAHPPSTVVLEFRWAIVEHESWFRGPYFRFWASTGDFLESRFYYWNAPLIVGFAENRVSPTFRYREAIDNWLSESARARRPVSTTGVRNADVALEMKAHDGMVKADFENRTVAPPNGGQRERRWLQNTAGELWLRRFLGIAMSHQARVVLLVPPQPPFFVENGGPDGYRATRDAQIERLRSIYPTLALELFEPRGFESDEFADDVHVNARGRERLSEAFAEWYRTHGQ